ncbi:site-specific integrase [Nitrosopumilus maritimus]|nr:site-specific integrase [Nitrosopumilus maritimus]
MEITLEKINTRSDPYQLFLDSIKHKETKRRYKNLLYTFLKLIPNEIYQDALGEKPPNNEATTLAKFFVDAARKSSDLASDIIAAYIKEDKKRVEAGEISPQTLPNHIKPIKVLLDSNRIAVHWKSLSKLYPRITRGSNDRAYTTEEMQRMLEVSNDITDKVIVTMFASAGFRLESWDYFTWKDVVFFRNPDDSFRGAALCVYRNDPEQYWTFITPEACNYLDMYREKWKADIGVYPNPDDPLLKAVKYPTIHRLNHKGVRRRVENVVRAIGLRPPLPPGRRRHEVKLDHGFRKSFNTNLRRAKVDFLDKEDMMGHKTGLEKHYERYAEEDFERFSEYEKAIPFLTISDTERVKFENQKLKEAKKNLEEQIPTLVDDAVERVKKELTQKGWTVTE